MTYNTTINLLFYSTWQLNNIDTKWLKSNHVQINHIYTYILLIL